MYCKYFGFLEKPFDLTPDHRFLYLTPGHREVLASIMYSIRQRRGLIALVGEAGTGKTMLLRAALKQLNGHTQSAFIFNSDLPFLQVMAMILDELGILAPVKKLTLVSAFRRLNDFAVKQFAAAGNVVIMIDEAQNFENRTIEGLRLLSNLESDRHKMIQVILSGQPALDGKLSKQAMQQFVQRISLRRCTAPLSEKYTYGYIEHRFKVAGYSGPEIFSKKARQLVWQHSGGVPRKINILCDNVLLNAYVMHKRRIEAIDVAEAINDLSLRFAEPKHRRAN